MLEEVAEEEEVVHLHILVLLLQEDLEEVVMDLIMDQTLNIMILTKNHLVKQMVNQILVEEEVVAD
jgi:hypothetical protein